MTIPESELCERLRSEDDAIVEAAVREYFEPQREPRLGLRWRLRPDVDVEPDAAAAPGDPDSWRDRLGARLLDLMNGALKRRRTRRFRRYREQYPHWRVVVAEGDSWVAHPLLDDIAEHLLDDDDLPYAVLAIGAADDRLADMWATREYARRSAEEDADALVLSAGGNDLLVDFGAFLRRWTPGTDPRRLVDDRAVDAIMGSLMATLRAMLEATPSRPIFVHGYDYLRVGVSGRGEFLSPLFDAEGIEPLAARRSVLRYIVDRYNEHVQRAVRPLPHVTYVDVRGVVPDAEWHDEIHPNGDGFSRLAAVFGQHLERCFAAR